MTSRCLGNGRSDASYKKYGGVSASYKQYSVSASYKQYVSDECTYNIQSRQKHNMLSLLHAACLKLLVFFLGFPLSHSGCSVGIQTARCAACLCCSSHTVNYKISPPKNSPPPDAVTFRQNAAFQTQDSVKIFNFSTC